MSNFNLNPDEQKKLAGYTEEALIALMRINQEQEKLKDIVNSCHDDLDINKRLFRKMVKKIYENSLLDDKQELSSLEFLCEIVTKQINVVNQSEVA